MRTPNRAERIHQTETHIKKQLKIRKKSLGGLNGDPAIKEPHRLAKKSAVTCGNPNCVMCGNPRKFFGEMTKQEQSFIQTGEWYEDSNTNEETEEPTYSSDDESQIR